MPLTPEQTKAEEDLLAAIKRVLEVHDYERDGMMYEYVLIGNMRRYDDDGEPVTGTFIHSMNDSVPLTSMMGLIAFADTQLRAYAASDANHGFED